MTVLWPDIRYTLRVLGRRPSFGVVAVLTLALGIGATSAMFTVINAVLLEPLPYPAADRVMRAMEVNERGRDMQVSDPNFEDLRDQSRSFAHLAQYAFWDAAVLVGREPLRTPISVVSAPFFDVIGVQPIIGRRFLPEETREGAPSVAIVSYGFWQRRLVLLLLGLFAGLALLLSVAGVYGALAYRVTERTREIGIRAALGAGRVDLLRLVLGHGARLFSVGLVVGAGLALALTGLLQSLLYGVVRWDPVTFLAVSLVLAAVALVASYVPARRATRVDPIVALRTE